MKNNFESFKKERREKAYNFYNNFAKDYDKNRYASENQKMNDLVTKRIILGLTKDVKGKNILDCGCGTGRFAELFIKEGANVTGSDISKNMLEIAKKKVPEAIFVKADIFALPFKDKTFDIAICSQVLTHLHSYEKPLLQLKKVVKDDGSIIIDIRNSLWPYRLPIVVKRLFQKASGEYAPDYISIFKIKRMCDKIGLKVVSFKGAGFPSKRERHLENEIKKSNGKLKYIAPTLIINIVKSK